MDTTVDKLNKLKTTKEAIRVAINNKGGTLTENDTFASYPTAIDNIQTGGGSLKTLLDATKSCYQLFYEFKGTSVDGLISYNDTSQVIKANSMFADCSSLITIPQLNMSSCADMSYMFHFCSSLTTIPQLNTSSCTNMTYMFNSCSKLTTISQLNTSSCTNMAGMFYECSSLTTIPELDTSSCIKMNDMFFDCHKLKTIPKLDTSSCTRMDNMFYRCYDLTTIDITHMNITSTSNNNVFASNCYALTKLIIRNMTTIPALNSNAFDNSCHFYGTVHQYYNPDGLKDARIYVPDDKVEELKTATNWSIFADIIVPLSTLVEE